MPRDLLAERQPRDLLAGAGPQGRRVQDIPESEFTPPNLALETAKGTARTLGQSAGRLVGGVAGMVRHPVQTAKTIGGTAVGAAQKLIPGKQSQERYVEALGDYYQGRYGGVENIAETVATDPFGYLTDVAMLAGGGGGALRGAGKATGIKALTQAGSFPATRAATQAVGKSRPVRAVAQAGKGVVEAPGKFSRAAAARTINSLIKPLHKDFSYGKNPGLGVAREHIIGNSWDDMIQKLKGKEGDLGRKIKQRVQMRDGSLKNAANLDVMDDLAPIEEAMQIAAQQNNQTVLNRLTEVKRALTEKLRKGVDETGRPVIESVGARNLRGLKAEEVWEMKKKIGDLTKFTGNPSDDLAVNKTLKQVYGNFKEKLNRAVPGLDDLNERFANITTARVASVYRDTILQRHNLLGLSPRLLGGAGFMYGMGAGQPGISALGLGIMGAEKLMGTPAFKTRMASALASGGGLRIPKETPFAAEILNRPGTAPLQAKVPFNTPGLPNLSAERGGVRNVAPDPVVPPYQSSGPTVAGQPPYTGTTLPAPSFSGRRTRADFKAMKMKAKGKTFRTRTGTSPREIKEGPRVGTERAKRVIERAGGKFLGYEEPFYYYNTPSGSTQVVTPAQLSISNVREKIGKFEGAYKKNRKKK